MRVVTLGQLGQLNGNNDRLPFTVAMGGLGDPVSEVQARNTRAVLWFVGIVGVVTIGGLALYHYAR